MKKVLIDTTKRYEKSVELVVDGNTVIREFGDIDIVGSIQKILDKNNLPIDNIDEITANPGPGSFTGIKVGVTIANVLNWALGKKKVGELQVPEYGREPIITPPKYTTQ